MQFGARAHSFDHVRALAEAGFGFAELDWKEPATVIAQVPELAALQACYGIRYLAHGPSERDPFDAHDLVHRLGPVVDQLLCLAPELGIPLHTQHLWLDPRFVPADVIAAKLDLLQAWLEAAGRAGVILCIENLSEQADHFVPAFERLPRLGLTLDLGHGEIRSRPNAAFDLIARFPDRIRHVHLHDNYGGSSVRDDLHLPIGQGVIDFPGILRALRRAGYAGGLSFEIDLPDAVAGREAIREMWNMA